MRHSAIKQRKTIGITKDIFSTITHGFLVAGGAPALHTAGYF